LLPFASLANDIAVVNVQQVLQESVAMQKVQEQVKVKRKSFQDEVVKKEESLRGEEKKLLEQRSLLAKEAFEEKAKELQTKVNDVNRTLQEKRIKYDTLYNQAVDEVQVAVNSIVGELAKEKNFKIALPKNAVLYSVSELDITKDVVTRLNTNLPKVKVDLNK
jgi:Skp family chaperone for outer membrane proteins